MAAQFSKRKYSILETKKQLLYEIQSTKRKGSGSSQPDSGDRDSVGEKTPTPFWLNCGHWE